MTLLAVYISRTPGCLLSASVSSGSNRVNPALQVMK